MNHCKVKVETNTPNTIIRYLKNMDVRLYDISFFNNYIVLELDANKLGILGNICSYTIVQDYRLIGLLKFFKNNWYSYVVLILFISIVSLCTSIIVSINISVLNREIRDKMYADLDSMSLKPFSFYLNDSKIDDIRKELLNRNKDTIEWLNIRRIGMKYVIDVTLKKDKYKVDTPSYCNVLSKKDAIISRISSSSGVEMVDINDFVKEGDTLISGDVTFNNNHNQVCANGKVYGKIWYHISLSIPKSKVVIKELGKRRYNILIHFNNKSYVIFKDRIDNSVKHEKKIFSFSDFWMNLITEVEKKEVKEELSKEEFDELVTDMVKKHMDYKIEGEYRILKQNVLKKVDNDSTMDIEIFIVTEEEIGVTT